MTVTNLLGGTLGRTLSFSFDAASQQTAAGDADSSYAYTYDGLGRVLTVSNSGTPGVPAVVLTSSYDANSRRTSLAATVGGTADFLNTLSYDDLGRLTRIDQTANGGAAVADKRVDFTYNAIGQFATIVRNNKVGGVWTEVATSSFAYDTLHRLTALDHTRGVNQLANYDWTYDWLDRVTQFVSPDGTSDYTYDKESQLTAADHSFQTDESFGYDATGNRTNTGYSTGANNRLLSDGTYNYTYDDEGNRLTRTKISDSLLTEYTWDHRNRLTKVIERAGGAGTAITKETNYKYDLFDRRISKSVDADGAGAGTAVVSRFVYDGGNIVLTFDGASNLTHRYLHGPAVDQILADEDATGDILWPLTDNLGTVRDLVESDGTVANHIEYDSFGNITAESNAAIDHLFAYTGRERDEETGLHYYRARYYDPAAGRFVSEDPAGFGAGDNNLTRYVSNNAVNLVDPSGRYSTGGSQEMTAAEIAELERAAREAPQPTLSDAIANRPLMAASWRSMPDDPGLPDAATIRSEYLGQAVPAVEGFQVLVSLSPGWGPVIDGNELISGTHFSTGRDLSGFERTLAGIGLVSMVLPFDEMIDLAARPLRSALQQVARNADEIISNLRFLGWLDDDGVLVVSDDVLPRTATQDHHIASHYQERFVELFQEMGSDVATDPRNIVPLPGHSGSHIWEYHEHIWRTLRSAADEGQEAFQNAQDALRSWILENPRAPFADGPLRSTPIDN